MSTTHPLLLAGTWRAAADRATFQAVNPRTTEALPDRYPVSPWADLDEAVKAAHAAFRELRRLGPDPIAAFLDAYAARIEARKADLVATAALETALPAEPRLGSVELPRTANQLRQAAAAARERSWALPTIDAAANIRSTYLPLGPVVAFGPNNFPFAFNGISGGDFAAALAAGCPVIAKAHPGHPGTTRIFAEEAVAALRQAGLPPATVQLFYACANADGERLVAHPLVGAVAFTGSRAGGLALKVAADRVGKPIYLELSSVNPLVILPGTLRERSAALVDEFLTSALMGAGQFCTNPGLVLLLAGPESAAFQAAVAERMKAAPVGTLLGPGVLQHLTAGVKRLIDAGAGLAVGGEAGGGTGCSYRNTLLTATGQQFLANPADLQAEAFGNAALFVTAADLAELVQILEKLEGNLTGCVYSAKAGADDAAYAAVEPVLRGKVGRLLNDKMPTGVAVSPAMCHGGPFPATGHPGFTAVGIPASLRRFGMLACYDNVREDRLPAELRNRNPTGKTWRLINGQWTVGDVG